MSGTDLEKAACTPIPLDTSGFNPHANLPFGLKAEHIGAAMSDFLNFLGFINNRLFEEKISRLESIMMSANFSSLVGEFMNARIPKHCAGVVKNKYHNGHPDLLPAGRFEGDAAQHAGEGIEIKASRYTSGWQGHNAEDTWLMVYVYDSNRVADGPDDPRPLRFLMVMGAQLEKSDWSFSGRSEESRRTITASVTKVGFEKMKANCIYRAPKADISLEEVEAELGSVAPPSEE